MRTAAWFATAVVVSVFATLLVMQEWRADAAPGDSDATWVAVEPCRLFDYRPGKEPLDGKKTPLAAGAPATQQVTGNVGNCKIPTTGVVAVAMNVTIVSPTAQSNLRLYPADAASEPVVSNLNWLAGDSATPNKVDVKLSATGAVKIAVANGTVNVLGDVVGYYTDTSLKELDTRVAALESKVIPSGVTVVGEIVWDTHGSTNTGTDAMAVNLPGIAPVALTDETVNFASDAADNDATCTGTATNPTAPAGKVCIYLDDSAGIDVATLEGYDGNLLPARAFTIYWNPNGTANLDEFLYASWAYTAP
jgi:hypothetical protein